MSRIPWIAFALMLLCAVVFLSTTVSSLPALVASHQFSTFLTDSH